MAQELALPSWRKFELILLLLSISISTILALNKELSEKLFVMYFWPTQQRIIEALWCSSYFWRNMLKALSLNLSMQNSLY